MSWVQVAACIAAIKELPHCRVVKSRYKGHVYVRFLGLGWMPSERDSFISLLEDLVTTVQGEVHLDAIYHADDDYGAWTATVARAVPFAACLRVSSQGDVGPLPAIELPLATTTLQSSVHTLTLSLGPLAASPLVALVNRSNLMFLELVNHPEAAGSLPPPRCVDQARIVVFPKVKPLRWLFEVHEWAASVASLDGCMGVMVAFNLNSVVFHVGVDAGGAAPGAPVQALVVMQETYPHHDVHGPVDALPAVPSEFPGALLVVNCRTGYNHVNHQRSRVWGFKEYSARVNVAQLRTVTWQRLQRGVSATRQLTAASRHTPTLRGRRDMWRCPPVWFQKLSERRPVETVLLHLMACLKRQRVEVCELALNRVACMLVVPKLIEVYGGGKFAARLP